MSDSTMAYTSKYPAFSMQMDYDRNGNITHLLRNKDAVAGSSLNSSTHTFDNLGNYAFVNHSNKNIYIYDWEYPTLQSDDIDLV